MRSTTPTFLTHWFELTKKDTPLPTYQKQRFFNDCLILDSDEENEEDEERIIEHEIREYTSS